MEWREVSLPALGNVLSTQDRQLLSRDQWAEWAQRTSDFVAAWYTPLDGPRSLSTGLLSTGNAQAWIEMERVAPGSTGPLRYYGYVYSQTLDGRIFQKGPYKDLGYARHSFTRPPFLPSSPTSNRSTST